MLTNLHFLRPMWFFAFFPLTLIIYSIAKQNTIVTNFQNICDKNLLPHLLKIHGKLKQFLPFSLLFGSGSCLIFALAGPSWSKIDVPIYRQIQPRIILLDMSQDMLNTDLSPSRLERAKFKLHGLLSKETSGQVALIAYTDEPFVVSPLTEDSKTIDSLLPILHPDIMPVSGNSLDKALLEAKKVFHAASNTTSGEVLVLTAKIPTISATKEASTINQAGLRVSIIPMLDNKNFNSYFQPLAKAGNGKVITLTSDDSDINKWLNLSNIKSSFQANNIILLSKLAAESGVRGDEAHRTAVYTSVHEDSSTESTKQFTSAVEFRKKSIQNIQLWKDEGRWFILLAILLLLPVFWRGWLEII